MENYTDLTDEEVMEIMEYFEIADSNDVDQFNKSWKHYGLNIFKIDGREYAVGTEDETYTAVYNYVEDSVWAFTSRFLQSHLTVDMDIEDIEHMQQKCESANKFFVSAIRDMDEFVEDAISADGKGHFLNNYDGEEIEIGDLLLYRVD